MKRRCRLIRIYLKRAWFEPVWAWDAEGRIQPRDGDARSRGRSGRTAQPRTGVDHDGLIAFHIGLTEEARMSARSLAIDPGDFFALTHIAYTHYLEGDWRRAVAAAAEVWRRAPLLWAGYQLAFAACCTSGSSRRPNS